MGAAIVVPVTHHAPTGASAVHAVGRGCAGEGRGR